TSAGTTRGIAGVIDRLSFLSLNVGVSGMARPRLIDDEKLLLAIVAEVERLRGQATARRKQPSTYHRPTSAEIRFSTTMENAANGIIRADFATILGRVLSETESMACHRSAARLEAAGKLVRLRMWGRNTTHLQLAGADNQK